MHIKINQSVIVEARQRVAYDLQDIASNAAEVARGAAPVDTSSLRESIQPHINIEGDKIRLIISAGGEDFSSQIMPSTGQVGNVVDYAAEQEAIHGFLELGLASLIDNFK